MPTPYGDVVVNRIDDPEVHAAEALAIARRGERRARSLDVIGWFVIAIGILAVIGGIAAYFSLDIELNDEERVGAALAGAGALLLVSVIGAVFLGFASLVRNSSRALSIAVIGTAIDDHVLSSIEESNRS